MDGKLGNLGDVKMMKMEPTFWLHCLFAARFFEGLIMVDIKIMDKISSYIIPLLDI
jgi:hypothetical protein